MSQMNQPPMMPPPVAPTQAGTGKATASLVLGLVSLIPGIGILTAIAGLILGILGRKTSARGMAIAGIIICSVMLPIQLLMPVILLPTLSTARSLARQAQCRTQLHDICVAIESYAGDHDGKYPQDLNALVPSYLSSPRYLHCPASSDATGVDYFYFSPPADAKSRRLMLCEFEQAHIQRSVAYSDGRIAPVSETAFQALLAKPENAAFAQAFTKARLERHSEAHNAER